MGKLSSSSWLRSAFAAVPATKSCCAKQQAISVRRSKISEKDSQFATCMQAMTLTQREDQLRWAYHSMLNLTPSDRMRRHQDIQVY
jgi:hypothetical protein